MKYLVKVSQVCFISLIYIFIIPNLYENWIVKHGDLNVLCQTLGVDLATMSPREVFPPLRGEYKKRTKRKGKRRAFIWLLEKCFFSQPLFIHWDVVSQNSKLFKEIHLSSYKWNYAQWSEVTLYLYFWPGVDRCLTEINYRFLHKHWRSYVICILYALSPISIEFLLSYYFSGCKL